MAASRRWLGPLAAVLLSFAGMSLLPGGTVTAMAKCYPGRQNDMQTYFNGWIRAVGVNKIAGVMSSTLNYSPWVEWRNGQSSEDVTAWTMLADDANHYAQVGWLEQRYDKRYTFTEYTDANGFHTRLWPSQPIGSTSNYNTLYQYRQNKFTLQWPSHSYNVPATFIPSQAQVLGEIHTLSSQTPGDGTTPESYDYTQVWIGAPGTGNGAWQNFDQGDGSTTIVSDYAAFIANEVWDPAHHLLAYDSAC